MALLKVGDRVCIIANFSYGLDGSPALGVVTACRPENGGYLVLSDGWNTSFGWGESELELIQEEEDPPNRFERGDVL